MEAWESSTRRTLKGGWARAADLPKGEHGRTLCRWCGLEVPAGRRTFCSGWCVDQWRLRSDPGYLRERLFERDRGVCAGCGEDTVAAWNWLRRLPAGKRRLKLADWGLAKLTRSSLWDADHIVPVAEGGGECDLDNMRTLCLRCHRKATVALRDRLKQCKVTQGKKELNDAGKHHKEEGTLEGLKK